MIARPILRGRHVLLRPLTVDDAASMLDSLDDSEGRRLTGTHSSFTLDMVRSHCERVTADESRLDYVVCRPDDPRYRGEVVLRYDDPDNHGASFRIYLAAWAPRGAGLGRESAELLLAHGFEVWPALHRIELEVFDFNQRAIRSYERVGFVREGLRRQALHWGGQYHDAVLMGLLRDEFPAARRAGAR
jgi:RimJ/RimL family protein N-acetyltransferase